MTYNKELTFIVSSKSQFLKSILEPVVLKSQFFGPKEKEFNFLALKTFKGF
jgi:hypothetical protein